MASLETRNNPSTPSPNFRGLHKGVRISITPRAPWDIGGIGNRSRDNRDIFFSSGPCRPRDEQILLGGVITALANRFWWLGVLRTANVSVPPGDIKSGHCEMSIKC